MNRQPQKLAVGFYFSKFCHSAFVNVTWSFYLLPVNQILAIGEVARPKASLKQPGHCNQKIIFTFRRFQSIGMLSKARIKYIKSLQIKKYRKQEQRFVVEGEKCVAELLPGNMPACLVLSGVN